MALEYSGHLMNKLFASNPEGGEAAAVHLVGSQKSGFSFHEGIPPSYMGRNGKKVVRADFNGLGRVALQGGYFDGIGGYYTFSPEVAEAIGGYPYGAILRWLDPDTGKLRTVRSVKTDNKDDFVADPSLIDGESWSFVDEILPTTFRPRIFLDQLHMQTGTLAIRQSVQTSWQEAAAKTGLRGYGYTPVLKKVIEAAEGVYDEFTAARDGLFAIQGGVDEDEMLSDGQPGFVWASVREAGNEDFYTAAMLAYIPLVNNEFFAASTDAGLVDEQYAVIANYNPCYSSSPVTIFLRAGDTVKLTANRVLSYSSSYQFIPLVS